MQRAEMFLLILGTSAIALLISTTITHIQEVTTPKWYNRHACRVVEKDIGNYHNLVLNCAEVSISIDLMDGKYVDSNVYVGR